MVQTTTKLELLAPARSLEFGRVALDFGADAVYIGAPRFGARATAGNSLHEIGQLCRYAHRFDARVLVAFNTLLYEHELEDARQLIWQLWDAGIDALIVQDMGILEMDLPPVPLHASTQAHNASTEKVQFLQQVGFSRVVLARELSLDQIAHIRASTHIELEAFVHGALCVSYSGQCWMSAHLGGRSGNRGECAQSCRLKFDLLDASHRPIAKGKNLLSIKDMNRSQCIAQMARAGVSSFKIEGRLKDLDYVKNITAHYRRLLDGFLEENTGFEPASRGRCVFPFEPDPQKSFNRGFTSYLKGQREEDLPSVSPKSTGQWLGSVLEAGKDFLRLESPVEVHNGDGLCFPDAQGDLQGFFVNKTVGDKIYFPPHLKIRPGTQIYRNYDHAFSKLLSTVDQCRLVEVEMRFGEHPEGFQLEVFTPDGVYKAEALLHTQHELARNADQARATLLAQLKKTGNTCFSVIGIELGCSNDYFIPIPQINQLRREALDALWQLLGSNYQRASRTIEKNSVPYPQTRLDYTANISNSLAALFYKRHGVEQTGQAFELSPPTEGSVLMTTKHCIRYAMGQCPHHQKNAGGVVQPAYLSYQGHTFRLDFDCTACRMLIRS